MKADKGEMRLRLIRASPRRRGIGREIIASGERMERLKNAAGLRATGQLVSGTYGLRVRTPYFVALITRSVGQICGVRNGVETYPYVNTSPWLEKECRTDLRCS